VNLDQYPALRFIFYVWIKDRGHMKPTHRGGTSVPRIAAVLFTLLVGACATADANPDASLIARIQNASTSADHMSLAEQYEREANTSRQKVAQHRKMYEAYRG
jgi:hypothetical protein